MNEYAAAAARATAHLDGDERLADTALVIEQCVHDDDGEIARWHLRLGDGRARVIDGGAADADVTISQDVDTAEAIRRGELHAQGAYLTGRLVIEGDVQALLEHGPLLVDLIGPGRA